MSVQSRVEGRRLPFYELVCAHININFMLKFELKNLNKDDLIEAIKLVKMRHPYMRMRIRKNEDSSMDFYEENETEFNDIYLDKFKLESESEFEDGWRDRLIRMANVPRDNSKSLSFFELYSYNDRHQLFAEINHSGIDGPGIFTIIKDFSVALDDILSKKLSSDELKQKFKSREFCEIHKEYKHSFDLEELKKEPLIKENYIKAVGLHQDPTEASVSPHIHSKFYKLDEQTSRRLIANTKKHGSTIQGLLSAAHTIVMIKYSQSNAEKPVVINAVPCNMRETLEPKLCNDDLVCGSAALIWPQETDVQKDSLWSLSADATKHIKELRVTNYGTKWWLKLGNSIETQPYSIMCSSMGVVSLNEDSLQNIKILDLRFMGGSYSTQPNAPGTMTHAFSFANQFTFNFSFANPALSLSWAEEFSQCIYKLLELAANDEHLDKKSVADLLKLLSSA